MCALASSTKPRGDDVAPIFEDLKRDLRAVNCDNPTNSSEVTQWVRCVRKIVRISINQQVSLFQMFHSDHNRYHFVSVEHYFWNLSIGMKLTIFVLYSMWFSEEMLFYSAGNGRSVLLQSSPKCDGRTSSPINAVRIHWILISECNTKLRRKCFGWEQIQKNY